MLILKKVGFDKNNLIEYTFKLKEGKSNQYIAFDILKQKGFSSNIIESAQKILNE